MYDIDRKQGPCKTSAFTTSIAENRKDSSNFYRLLGADKIQSSNVTKNLGGVTKTNAAINVMPHPPQCGFGVGLAGAIDK